MYCWGPQITRPTFNPSPTLLKTSSCHGVSLVLFLFGRGREYLISYLYSINSDVRRAAGLPGSGSVANHPGSPAAPRAGRSDNGPPGRRLRFDQEREWGCRNSGRASMSPGSPETILFARIEQHADSCFACSRQWAWNGYKWAGARSTISLTIHCRRSEWCTGINVCSPLKRRWQAARGAGSEGSRPARGTFPKQPRAQEARSTWCEFKSSSTARCWTVSRSVCRRKPPWEDAKNRWEEPPLSSNHRQHKGEFPWPAGPVGTLGRPPEIQTGAL